jgi:hypothetical protein
MPRLILILAAITLVMLPWDLYAADDITVSVSLNRDKIGLDETAILAIEVSGAEQNLPAPQLPTLPAFEIYSQGRSSNLSIVNGVISSSVVHRYLMIPQKAGSFPIDRIAVVHGNRRFKGNSVVLTVLAHGTQGPSDLQNKINTGKGNSRDYMLHAEVSTKNPYVNQQVTLTLKFLTAIKYYGSPELAEPATTGFWTEVIGNKTPYYQQINDRRYKVIERKYALFPTQTGELTIGRAALTATMASTGGQTRNPLGTFGSLFGRGREVTVRSQPISIEVRPLPRKGRPKDYTGSIGKYKMTVRPDKTEVEVNQPVTLTINISGTGNIKAVAEPAIPELDDFRIYRASARENASSQGDKLGGTKIFEEVFIPRRPGKLEIPALSFSFFDPESGRYRTVESRAIKLNVTKPEGFIASADLPYAGQDLTIGSRARDIRHIQTALGQLQPVNQVVLFTPTYIIVNALPTLAFVGLLVARRRRDRLASNTGLARSRAATKMARQRLAQAQVLAVPDKAEEFYAEIYKALTSYLADKLNISPHGLTSGKIEQIMTSRTDDLDLIGGVLAILQECDFARYTMASISEGDMAASLKKVEELMVKMEGVRFA